MDDPDRPPDPAVRVLLVDDEPANLLALEAVLGDLGLDLVRTPSGEEALRLLSAADFAAVLLDVRLRGMDGFQTAHQIRAGERSRRTPIIFLTAYEDDRFPAERAYALGAVDYLVKPFVPAVLRAQVSAFAELYLEKRRAGREAEQLRTAAPPRPTAPGRARAARSPCGCPWRPSRRP